MDSVFLMILDRWPISRFADIQIK